MTEPRQYFRTMTGEPPNGGVPPGTAFIPVVGQPPAKAPTPVCPPPYCMHQYTTQLDPRMWLPPQQVFVPPTPSTQPPVCIQHFPFHAQIFVPPPPPPPTALPSAQWSPPGANLLGQPAPNFEGVNYLYPKDHTVLHIIMDKFMQLNMTTRLPKYEPRLFPTGLRVSELIKQLGAPNEEEEPYGVMEVHEMGDGRWATGQTVLLGSEHANKTLKEIGWGETRGFAAKPVWLKIHKVE
ncbi:MAG: hypothetical protein L6R41_007017 [Letrouitia leprolyta]|nr:MAG: hypothetical protein L6R41_007017 [Letrouitia leprolyta]